MSNAGGTNVGGLNYEIAIKDSFSTSIKNFREGISKARQEFRQFVSDMRYIVQHGKAAAKQNAKVAASGNNLVAAQKGQTEAMKGLLSENITDMEAWAKARARLEKKAAANLKRTQAESASAMRQIEKEKRDLERETLRLKKAQEAEDKKVRASHEAFWKKERQREAEEIQGRLRTIQLINRKAAALKKQAAAAREAADVERRRAADAFANTPLGQAQARIARADRESKVRELLAQSGRSSSGNVAEAQTKETISAANRISFTFRRLIGIFAVFQGIRIAVGSFRSLVEQAIHLNAELETAANGLASVFVASSEVRDDMGNLVSTQEAFNKAVSMSQQQIKLLRIEGLKTNATFEQLLKTFQSAAAPGREAGLSPSQIRQLTIRIAQAAAAQGVPQNQLDEEVRSLLSGTATSRTTRLAQSLGGATAFNKALRDAREQGKVFEFLSDRLETFAFAGEKALNTFAGAMSNAKDAILLVAQTGALEFFEELKGLLLDVQNLARSQDDQGFALNPEALASSKLVFDQLAEAAQKIRAALADENLFADLAPAFEVLGRSLNILTSAVIGGLRGFSRGLGPLARLLGVSQQLSVSLEDVAQATTQILTTMVSAHLVLGPVLVLVKDIQKQGLAATVAISNGAKALTLTMLGLLAAVDTLTRYFTGDVGLKTLVTSIFAGFEEEILKAEKLWIRFMTILGRTSVAEEDARVLEINQQLQAIADSKADPATAGLLMDQILKRDDSLLGTLNSALDKITESVFGKSTFSGLLQGLSGVSEEADEFGLNLFNSRKRLEENVEMVKKLEDGLKKARQVLEDARLGGGPISQAFRNRDRAVADAIAPLKKEQREFFNIYTSDASSVAAKASALDKLIEINYEIEKVSKDIAEAANMELQAQILIEASKRKESLIEKQIAADILGVQASRLSDEEKILKVAELTRLQKQKQFDLEDSSLKKQGETLFQALSGTKTNEETLEIENAILDLERERAILAKALSADMKLITDQALAQLTFAKLTGDQLLAIASASGLDPDSSDRRANLEGVIEGDVNPLLGAIKEAFFQLGFDLPNEFGLMLETMKTMVQSFSEFAADAFVDLLDPTAEANLQERFARLLQGIAKQVISTLIQIAITRAALNLGGLFSGGAGGAIAAASSAAQSVISGAPGAGGAHRGALITRRGPQASFRQGYASGGEVTGMARHHFARPQGLHHTDRIPIWTAEGEVVHKRAAVQKYGLRFMKALNDMRLPAEPLRALAGSVTVSRIPDSPKRGYATGGVVSAPQTSSVGVGAAPASGGMTQAYLVADEQALDRMLAGGKNAQLSFMRRNRDAVKQALGIRR